MNGSSENYVDITGLRKDLPLLDAYLHQYGDGRAMPAEQYLKDWYEAKSKDLLPIFGGKLIIKEDVSYRKPDEELCGRISEKVFTNEWEHYIHAPIMEMMEDLFFDGLPLFKAFGWRAATTDSWRAVTTDSWRERRGSEFYFYRMIDNVLTSSKCFATNAVGNNAELKATPVNRLLHTIRLFDDQKPFKMINTVLKEFEPICRSLNPSRYNDEYFASIRHYVEEYRIIHSQCLNSRMLKGRLCLSIHPMDFITMSDNDYNWDSCMTWTRDDGGDPGEYRVGTLEMMNSPCVIIAYLEGKDPWYPCGSSYGQWSNKKWRSLYIVHRNVITSVRHYPYTASSLDEIVVKKLVKMCEDYGWPAYTKPKYTVNDGYIEHGDYEIHFATNLMYNDSQYYHLYNAVSTQIDPTLFTENYGKQQYICYSGVAKCLRCGHDIDYDSSDDCSQLYCGHCDGSCRCYYCGEKIYPDLGGLLYIDNEPYCTDCASTCELCGEPYLIDHEDESLDVFDIEKEDGYYRYSVWSLCKHCAKKYKDYLVTIQEEALGGGPLRYHGDIVVIAPDAPDELFSMIHSALNIRREDMLDPR